MTASRFIQIHTLTSYPGTLLNRDDAGFAKRLPFGGYTRTRVSSQCLKRHWRTFDGDHALRNLDVPMSVRSRETFERLIVEPLAKELNEKTVRAGALALMEVVFGESAKKKKAKGADEELADRAKSAQVTILGYPEVEYLRNLLRQTVRDLGADANEKTVAKAIKDLNKGDLRNNLEGLKLASGLDAALFGRMVTSDVLARGDAAIHVAHALTVHAEASETDYFSAVDDLLAAGADGELGSGHINSSELTSGLFYGYVVVDVPLLVSNLTGVARSEWHTADHSLAARVVESLVHMVATVSPGAKVGSTAPYSAAHMVLVESGSSQPRTLANAFLTPVCERPELLANTYEALGAYVEDLDAMYGRSTERRLAATREASSLGARIGASDRQSVAEVASWAALQIEGAAHA